MKVCWFSGGVSSFIACYLAKDVDKIIYTSVANQHPDTDRFLRDAERILGKIDIISSTRYQSVDDVIMKTRCINTPFGAPCTRFLKREVRKEWEKSNPDHHIYVWGFDSSEEKRANRLVESMPDYEHDFPEVFERRAKEERMIGHSCIKGVFLDELDPKRGRIEEEVMEECGIMCELINRNDTAF